LAILILIPALILAGAGTIILTHVKAHRLILNGKSARGGKQPCEIRSKNMDAILHARRYRFSDFLRCAHDFVMARGAEKRRHQNH
jgi:hypothetical protein